MTHNAKNYTLMTTRQTFFNDIRRIKTASGKYLWNPGRAPNESEFAGIGVDQHNNDIEEIMQKVRTGDLKVVGVIVESQ